MIAQYWQFKPLAGSMSVSGCSRYTLSVLLLITARPVVFFLSTFARRVPGGKVAHPVAGILRLCSLRIIWRCLSGLLYRCNLTEMCCAVCVECELRRQPLTLHELVHTDYHQCIAGACPYLTAPVNRAGLSLMRRPCQADLHSFAVNSLLCLTSHALAHSFHQFASQCLRSAIDGQTAASRNAAVDEQSENNGICTRTGSLEWAWPARVHSQI